MTKRQRHPDRCKIKMGLTQTPALELTLWITFFGAIALALIFRVGEAWWSLWMVSHRTQLIGLVLFILLFLIALSPLFVEANTNPRPLSGPGKNPKGPWGP